jgi:NADH-quinone oxidoreductase subunit E
MSKVKNTQIPKFKKVCEILARYNNDSSKLIPILQAVQDEYRYLPEEIMTFIATSVKIPPAFGLRRATFYAHFSLEPKGKYVVKLSTELRATLKIRFRFSRRYANI